jgi:starch synthase (maltosyl-transferring)
MTEGRTHVALLTTTLDVSGAEKVVALLADGLSREGYRVSVVGLQRRSGALRQIIHDRGVEVIDLGVSGPWDVAAIGRLRRWLVAERVSILYTFLFHAHVIGRYAAHQAGTPYVISSQQSTAWDGAVRRMLDRWTARWCDCVVAVSDSARRDLISTVGLPPDQVRVIVNAVDVTSFWPTTRPFERTQSAGHVAFGSASRLTIERDHESLLHGFAAAWRRAPHLRLRLAGAGPLRPRLENLARSEGVADVVTFLGQVDDVRAFYDELDVYVQPSRTEGLPCAVVEAMAMSRPVVATDVAGNRDAVAPGETGWLIPPGSSEAWTAGMLEAARDPSRAMNFGRSGRQRAEDLFDVRRMIRSTVELITELAARRIRSEDHAHLQPR